LYGFLGLFNIGEFSVHAFNDMSSLSLLRLTCSEPITTVIQALGTVFDPSRGQAMSHPSRPALTLSRFLIK
jgi:hypothetical protein